MIQAIVRKGKVTGEAVPAPAVSEGSLLIKVVNSCISAGTEISGVAASSKSLIKRSLEQPENVRKALNMMRSDGIIKTIETVLTRIDNGAPTGYSISGVVIGVGEGVTRFNIGDDVAAAGAGIANHAEYVDVPENLVMKIPSGMSFIEASTVTVGGIALQGIRRADLRLGEYGVVFGCGLLGLLTIQMLKISGTRVAAIDLNGKRLQIAKDLGSEIIINPSCDDPVKAVENWSGGFGADAVIFTANTSDSEALSQSFRMCRRKGRVILVGVAGMKIKREDMYQKELDFLISTSCGPGRYDNKYEEKGVDYPYAYVRWTENRNMEEYLRLVNNKSISLERLINEVFHFEDISKAFDALQKEDEKPIMVILDYGKPEKNKYIEYLNHKRTIVIDSESIKKNIINIALIGAGSFATATHLPNIKTLKDKYNLYAVLDKNGLIAKTIAEQNNAKISTTDYNAILSDDNIDIVMICTRHDSHAELTLRALEAGKHVFVEKPLATNKDDLDKIIAFYNSDVLIKPVLLVGFNRRFSKYAREIKKHVDKRINPLFIHYRMNAGYIPLDNWVHQNGGRIVGEACHIIDLMTYLTGSNIKCVSADSLCPINNYLSQSDNKSIILKYADGSLCTIEYFAVGSKDFSKEYMEVHFDGKSIVLDDYKVLKGYGVKVKQYNSKRSEKGHLEELVILHERMVADNKVLPIDLHEIIQTTYYSLLI